MRLFSYLSRGQVRSARLVGELGLDLNYSAALFSKDYVYEEMPFDGLPLTVPELLLTGPQGIEFANQVTDWVLFSLESSNSNSFENETVFSINDVTFLAPIPRPGKVICVAENYPTINKLDQPEYPTVFLKPSGGVIGNQHSIVIPDVATNVANEVELAIVIGKRGRNLTPGETLSVVAGYTVANDLGDRILEKRTSQWSSGKMFDTFTPMGPILITPDELISTSYLSLITKVNDCIVQKGNTSQMFFDVPQLIRYISTITTLYPGDVVLTGSPKMIDGEPNPSVVLRPGDCVEVGIETIATLTNSVIAE